MHGSAAEVGRGLRRPQGCRGEPEEAAAAMAWLLPGTYGGGLETAIEEGAATQGRSGGRDDEKAFVPGVK